MRHLAQATVLILTFIFAATPARANTIDVRVLSATLSATVTVGPRGVNPAVTETKTSTGVNSASESLHRFYCANCEPGPNHFDAYAYADAAAGLLDVSASGSALWYADAVASADSELTFSPLRNGVAYIDIQGDNNFIEAWQSASLFDLTANEQVWYFDSDRYDLGISETVPTLLNADHVYVMHLNAFAAGRGDDTWSNLRVSNLHVPDNGNSFGFVCIGLLVTLLAKWKLPT